MLDRTVKWVKGEKAMKRDVTLGVGWLSVVAVILANSGTVFAQSSWASEGPVVHGHHHLNASDRVAHEHFWRDTLGGIPTPWRDVEVFKFPNAFVFLADREPSGGTIGTTVNHIGFWVPDARAVIEKVRAAGYAVITEQEAPNATVDNGVVCPEGQDWCYGYVLAPDDVKVEFVGNRSQTIPIQNHHIHLNTPDVDTLRAWYVDMFNAVPGMNGNLKVADLPGVTLRFSETSKMVGTQGRGLDHIGLEIDGLEAFCKALEAKGVTFDRPYRRIDELGVAIAFLTDPDGTYIELTEGLDNY